jgi:hypothetical protein
MRNVSEGYGIKCESHLHADMGSVNCTNAVELRNIEESHI